MARREEGSSLWRKKKTDAPLEMHRLSLGRKIIRMTHGCFGCDKESFDSKLQIYGIGHKDLGRDKAEDKDLDKDKDKPKTKKKTWARIKTKTKTKIKT